MQHEVVITGMGVVTPSGIGCERFLQALLQGQSGIDEIRSFDTTAYRVHRGGEVHPLPALDLGCDLPPHLGRATHFALAAVREALGEAALLADNGVLERTGIIMGSTSGEALFIEDADAASYGDESTAFPAPLYAAFSSNLIASTIAAYVGLRGPVMMLTNACSSGNFAIDYGRQMILQGEADIIIAGGTEALSKVAVSGFSSLHAVAPETCQPFDRDRKGMMVSEGAGVVVLESQHQAERRGVRPRARILGSGVGCDAFHLTAPNPEGMADTMRQALDDAQLPYSSQSIDYINAHGTGTELNDAAETQAIKMVFGEEAYKIPVSSIKSMIGHTLGASSAIETVACCLALAHGFLPPTINYHHADPSCDLDYVPQQARRQRVGVIMNNSFAFGGNNASLILGRSEAGGVQDPSQ